jgi:dipeptidyl aminopeptidase/acylaminoacyl peptidase
MKRSALMTANTAPIYAAPGYLIFTRNEALLAQRFDPAALKLEGDPVTLGEPPVGQTQFTASPCASVSTNGVLAWMRAGKLDTRLAWVDRAGRSLGAVDLPLDRWDTAVISPDGRRAAVQQDVASGNSDLWTVDLERGTASRLTYGEGQNNGAVWSPDGRELIYSSTRDGVRNLYRRPADGSGTDQPFYRSSVTFKDANSWSPDGRTVVISQVGSSNNWDILSMPAAGGPPTPLLDSRFNEQNPLISPDGAWLLYTSDESGSNQAYVQSFPGLGHKQQLTKTGALFGWWAKGGREIILFRPDLDLVSIPVEAGPELRIGAPREMFRIPSNARSGWPAPDGQRFLIVVPAVETVPAISIAVNWRAGLTP